jgi:Flp pilus assembly pilin Flp
MNKITRATRNLNKDTRGASLVEYIILVGLVALAAAAGFKVFGGSVSAKITNQAGQVSAM